MLDLVIHGGDVVDGSGMPRFRADVGIKDGKIAAVGRIREPARQRIDAEGHVVTPGFIDVHTHMDAQINWDPLGTCSSWHGVTSVVMGNCGFTLAPARADARELVVRNLERAEAIPAEALAAGIEWSWETFPEYLDAMDRLPKGINYSSYVGHSALRTWAMGERAFDGAATPDEIALMKQELRQALQAGAVGLSTTRGIQHETLDGRPVSSRLAPWDEVRELVSELDREAPNAMFQLAPENEHLFDPERRAEWLRRLRALATDSGVPVTFGVTVDTDPARWEGPLQLLDDVAAVGGRMYAQTRCKELDILFSFKTMLPFDRLPAWREVRERPLSEQMRLLRDPKIRARLVRAAREGPYDQAVGAEARKPDWTLIAAYDRSIPAPPLPSIAELAARAGADPVEIVIDLALKSDFNQLFSQVLYEPSEEEILTIIRHPRAIMTFSDSGAHVSQIISSIHTYLLAYWVRERHEIGLEEAVRMITQAPAVAWGFFDRGLLRVGMAADLNVIDMERLALGMPELVYDLPGNAKRFVQHAKGIAATVVNGEVVLRNGQHTGALPGRLLRRSGAQGLRPGPL